MTETIDSTDTLIRTETENTLRYFEAAQREIEAAKKAAIESINSFVASTNQALSDQYNPLKTQLDEASKIPAALNTLKAQIENDTTNFPSVIEGFRAQHTAANTEYETTKATLGELQKQVGEIKTYYESATDLNKKLFDDEKGEDGSIIAKSLKTRINEMEAQIVKMHQDEKVNFENLKTELKTKIEDLLPGAGAAGLASTYLEATNRYKFWLATIFNYLMFLAPLAIISRVFYKLFEDVSKDIDNFEVELLLIRLAISTPLAIISYFGFSSIRLNRRLYEEYNHKRRVMQLYGSFKKEVEDANDPERKRDLLDIMRDTVNYKPSKVMGKYDGEYKTSFGWGLFKREKIEE